MNYEHIMKGNYITLKLLNPSRQNTYIAQLKKTRLDVLKNRVRFPLSDTQNITRITRIKEEGAKWSWNRSCTSTPE
jgi:hypothetical protein